MMQQINKSGEWPELTSEAKPWTRWWWLGSSVDCENITDLLERYATAGIGGVEITPIYGVQGDEANEVSYLSPQWVQLLEFTISEAHRLGMQVDMPTGTGWPFGGPQVSDAHALDRLILERTQVHYGEPVLLKNGAADVLAITAYSDDGRTVRLDDRLRSDGSIDWNVPDGHSWNLYTARIEWGGRNVKRAAPGGEGKCINPFSKESLRTYLSRFDEAFEELKPGALRCHFHDSFEYLADFSPGFFEEFRVRRGYDLAQHLDALLGDIADRDRTARVKTDYRETISEVLLENFTECWSQWAHSKGSWSRNQAHGSPGNLLDLYGTPDIPETETFGGVGDPIVNKFASSAAHLSGRKYCSSESCTWLGEHFNVSLAQCKDAIDGLFVSGINHIFYHGTAYSPLSDPWPGRLFYASTAFAPQDPLWRNLPVLNAYVARCQAILQAGHPDNDFLIYWTLPDLWMKRPEIYMLEIDGNWIDGQPFTELSRRLWNKGFQFDYVSDRQLGMLAEKGVPSSCKSIVVPACDFIPLETLESLCSLADTGVQVFFVDRFPRDLPGYGSLDDRRSHFKELVSRAKSTAELVAADTLLEKLKAYGIRRELLADLEGVQIIRRQSDFGIDYFVVNRGASTVDGWFALGVAGRAALLMDPMTAKIGISESRATSKQMEIRLQLAPGQSSVIRVIQDDAPPFTIPWQYIDLHAEFIPLVGEWTIEFIEGGPLIPQTSKTYDLGSWTDLGIVGADIFAGTVRYTLVFESPGSLTDNWLLDLGTVADSASVSLNGRDLGTLIASPFRWTVEGLLPTGNTLQVCVTNVAANRIRGMDRQGERWRIFKEINFVDRHYQPFDASSWEIRPAGLLGPVTLANVLPKNSVLN